jgi:hypothetical protein
MVAMTQIEKDAALIAELGGPAKVAELLSYADGGVQRVFNWTVRGIPSAIKLERPDLFLRDFPAFRKQQKQTAKA